MQPWTAPKETAGASRSPQPIVDREHGLLTSVQIAQPYRHVSRPTGDEAYRETRQGQITMKIIYRYILAAITIAGLGTAFTAPAIAAVPLAGAATGATAQEKIPTPQEMTATTRQKIVDVATRELGGKGCNPGYFHSCGMDWCAEFARWAWDRAGVTNLRGLDGYAESFRRAIPAHYHSRSSGYRPQAGDAITFDWDHDPNDKHPADHVAIVTSVNNNTIYTIGGNQGSTNNRTSQVSRASYASSDNHIMGYTEPTVSDVPVDPPQPTSSGAVVFKGNLYLCARGAGGTIKYWYGSGVGWSAPQTLGSGVAGEPVATVAFGFLFVFATGSDGRVKYWYGNGGPWSAAHTIPGASSLQGPLTAISWRGLLFVFATGSDGRVKYWYGNGGPWSAAQTIPGASSLGAGLGSMVFKNVLFVFATGSDGRVKYWYGTGGPWSAAQGIPGAGSINGALCSAAFKGYLFLFGRASDGTVKYWYGNGGPWSAAQTIPGAGSINGALSSAVFKGYLFLFGRASDGSLHYWYGNGGPWSSLQRLGSGLS
jgi:hypothetical protein